MKRSVLASLYTEFGKVIMGILFLLVTISEVGAQADLGIKGGQYFDTESGEFRANSGIQISGGRIVALDSAEFDADAFLELEDDHFILPGFVDLHAHYNLRLFRKRREEYLVMPVVYLANGATTTFSAGEFDPEAMDELRKELEAGNKLGPRLLTSGPYFGRARPGWPRDGKPAEEIRAEVRYWSKRGASGFKAKAIRPDDLQVLIEEAHAHGKTVTGHLDSGYRNSVNPAHAIDLGIDRIEHFLGRCTADHTLRLCDTRRSRSLQA